MGAQVRNREQKNNPHKPRIMLIPDSVNWILGTWAQEIEKWNSEKYDFIIFPYSELQEDEALFISLLGEVDAIHCLSQTVFPQVKEVISRSSIQSSKLLISSIHHIVHFHQIEACLQADRIMVVCKQYLNELVNKGIPEEKLSLVYNGIDTDFFFPKDSARSKHKFGISPESFTIGFSAKASSDHDGRKGVDIFTEVLSELSALELDIQAIITGPGWDELIASNSFKNISFHYFPFLPTRRMPEFYNALDVYLVTARVEGGPVPPLEAMSCGTAVISTPVGTMLDFIQDGVNGLVIPFNDVPGTVQAVQKLYNDRNLAAALGARGRETILQNLQWKHTVSKIEELYGCPGSQGAPARLNQLDSRKIDQLNSALRKRDIRRWQTQHNLQSKGARLYRQMVSPVKRVARKILHLSRSS